MASKKEESLLANLRMAPRDAILGLTETYLADPNPKKVNLGVGVYYDDQGKVPLLECVRRADEALTAAGIARPYLAMDGFPEFVRSVQTLLFGADHPAVAQGRVRPCRESAVPGRSRSARTSSNVSPPRPRSTYPTRATTTTGRCSRRLASGSRCTPITIRARAESSSRRCSPT